MTIDTQFGIGDTVYKVNSYGYEKDIIRAIKVTGEKRRKVEYGFKVTGPSLYLFHSDDYAWYDSKLIFTNEDKASNFANRLIADREAEKKAEKEQELIKRKARLKSELEQLEAGIDPDEDEEL